MLLIEYILFAVITAQVLFTWQVVNNYRNFLNKYKRRRDWYRPLCSLIVPCRGIDQRFEDNIKSLLYQDYNNYHIRFVVQSQDDPAYSKLIEIIKAYSDKSQAHSIEILVSSLSKGCSQKIHNLLYAYKKIPANTEILAFADSDIDAKPNWMAHLVYPLRKSKNGLASGYRWFVPSKNNFASLALSAMNAKICQMLGNTRLNLAWGGSMGITVDNFKKLNIEKVWEKSLSDDLSISRCVRKTGLKIAFVPACMIASYQQTTWQQLWEFCRRQFIITRIYSPSMWLFGLISALLAVAGLWGGCVLAIWAIKTDVHYKALAVITPVCTLLCEFIRALIRQRIIFKLLPKEKKQLRAVRLADILFFWFWTFLLLIILLSTISGRTIIWRNIKYIIKSPTNIDIINRK